ncbi:MAG: hypothetical protein KF745_14520 [Phycisphaeraceae bacterium]|nr:hypothetical protein [Phycisphaeraceae bacterium]
MHASHPAPETSLLSALLNTTSPPSIAELAARFKLDIPTLLRSIAAIPDLDQLLAAATRLRLAAAHLNAITSLDALINNQTVAPEERRRAATTILRFFPLQPLQLPSPSPEATSPRASLTRTTSLPTSRPADPVTPAVISQPTPTPPPARTSVATPTPTRRGDQALLNPRLRTPAASLLSRAGAAAAPT